MTDKKGGIEPADYARMVRHAMRLEDIIAKAAARLDFFDDKPAALEELFRGLEGYMVSDDWLVMDWIDEYWRLNEQKERNR